MKKIWVSVDVESDISKYLSGSYLGIETALPRLLDLFKDYRVPADFFILGEVADSFPDAVRRILGDGHALGSHSYAHDHLCGLPFDGQVGIIRKSIDSVRKITGQAARMFRAPNFSADGTTVRALERLGVGWDSSVLPGRFARKWRVRMLYDHRRAPREPYHPSIDDVDVPGQSPVVEVPVTENRLQPCTPIGLGFLNSHSLEATLHAIDVSADGYAAFLIHPWEGVDLPVREFHLPKWLGTACRSDLKPFEKFIEAVSERAEFTNLSTLVQETVLAVETGLRQ